MPLKSVQKYTAFLLLGVCYWICNSGFVPLLLCTPHLWSWGVNTHSLWGDKLGAHSLPCSPGFTLGMLQVHAEGRGSKSYFMKSFCLASGDLYVYTVCIHIYTL